MRLSKYEKETIILTSEGDDTVQIYTFNASLKRRLAEYVPPLSEERRKVFSECGKKYGMNASRRFLEQVAT